MARSLVLHGVQDADSAWCLRREKRAGSALFLCRVRSGSFLCGGFVGGGGVEVKGADLGCSFEQVLYGLLHRVELLALVALGVNPVFQKLSARSRSGSVSETITVSSTNLLATIRPNCRMLRSSTALQTTRELVYPS